MKMDLKNLHRLTDVQEGVIDKTESQIKQIEKYKGDYEALRGRLSTLPDKVTHDIMVPFGTVAFMPGKLIHTNEILTYLGDGYFATRSAKQAIEIIDRRIETLNEELTGFQSEKKFLKPHLEFATEFKDEAEQTFNFSEVCTEEELTAWRGEHHAKVKKYNEEMMEARKKTMTDEEEEAYWKQMEEKEALGSSTYESSSKNSEKTVRWKDVEEAAKQLEEETGEENKEDDSSDDSEEYVKLCRPSIIHFSHTPVETTQTTQKSTSTENGVREILSPADIGVSFVPAPPKSILKKNPSLEEKTHRVSFKETEVLSSKFDATQLRDSKIIDHTSSSVVTSESSSSRSEHCSISKRSSIQVIERNVDGDSNTTPDFPSGVTSSSVDCTAPSGEPARPVSKFKAARMKKEIS